MILLPNLPKLCYTESIYTLGGSPMNKKKTLIIGISIIVVCLAIALGYVLTHRS